MSCCLAVELEISETEVQELLTNEQVDLRALITENRKRKMEDRDVELERAKEALRKVEGEMSKMREEMAQMQSGGLQGEGYALGFVQSTYVALDPAMSLPWVANTLAKEMKKEMLKYPNHFENKSELGGAGKMGYRACVKYNRGEECANHWHVQTKQKKSGSPVKKELRLHCCALCKEALDMLACHSLLACPWLRVETWEKVKSETNSIKN